ncbi:hypothetical protein RRG08_023192 [Elysia crispata]|uniref:Uncharacterized protein n=1 Tax=Elysia crispata TaxID=231223 RepID=A0AAE0ZPY6_9GAST|nr:hypothetical protein RRG08_023192 [Elysia crispata]
MLELLSMLRPLTTWQMLLGVCLLDLALIAMRLSWPGVSTSSHQQRLQTHRLEELLARQAVLARKVEDSRRQLEESRQQVYGLMAYQASKAAVEAEQMRLLAQGVDDLEQGLARLLKERAQGTRDRQNGTHTGLVT